MENHQASVKKIALNYGLLLALLSIVLQVISYVLDAHIDRPWWLSVLQFGISIGVTYMGIKAYKTGNAGFLTLGEALKTGVAISFIAGIIAVIFNYIFMNYIDPEFIQKTMVFTQEQMVKDNPNMTQEQIDNAMAISSKLMTPIWISGFAMIATLFFGFIISLVIGLIMKKNPPNQF